MRLFLCDENGVHPRCTMCGLEVLEVMAVLEPDWTDEETVLYSSESDNYIAFTRCYNCSAEDTFPLTRQRYEFYLEKGL